MNKLDEARRVAVINCLVEGNSIRATCRLGGGSIWRVSGRGAARSTPPHRGGRTRDVPERDARQARAANVQRREGGFPEGTARGPTRPPTGHVGSRRGRRARGEFGDKKD